MNDSTGLLIEVGDSVEMIVGSRGYYDSGAIGTVIDIHEHIETIVIKFYDGHYCKDFGGEWSAYPWETIVMPTM